MAGLAFLEFLYYHARMKCQSCGHTVTRRAQFCAHCGAGVVMRVNEQKAAPEKPRWPIYAALILGGLVAGALMVYFIIQPKNAPTGRTHFDGTLHGAALAQQYPDVYEVASQFICPCGTCTDGLEVCDCGMPKGSTEVRTLIYQLLQQHHVPHVIELIDKQYGYRKNSATPTLPTPSSNVPNNTGWVRPR